MSLVILPTLLSSSIILIPHGCCPRFSCPSDHSKPTIAPIAPLTRPSAVNRQTLSCPIPCPVMFNSFEKGFAKIHTLSLSLSQTRGCPGSKPLLLLCAHTCMQHFLLAARCFAAKFWILRFTAVLFCHKPGAFQSIPPYVVRAQHNSQV